jgi:hypothetical protein
MLVRRVAIGLVCLLAVGCASRGAAALTGGPAQPKRDPARWGIYVPPGWHVVRFSAAKGSVRAAGIQLSNVRLPPPKLLPGTPVEVNGQVLPPRGVGLVIASATEGSRSHGTVARPPLPAPWPDGSRGWTLASSPARSPVFEWLWFRAYGATYIAAITIGWKASHEAQQAVGQIIRSIRFPTRRHARPGSPVPPPGPVKLARFTRYGLSFRYPATWRARSWNDASSFSALITYLSTSQLRNPCTRSTTATSISVSCGEPIRRLPAGGLLVTWTANGFPGGPGITKTNSLIGGRPAVVMAGVLEPCAGIGGDEAITVKILRAVADNWYTMTACLRAPGVRQDELAVRAMLKSVRISGS